MVVQGNTPILQVVYLVHSDLRALEAKMSKKNTQIEETLDTKTTFLESENQKKTNAIEELYDIGRSLDAVAVEVCSLM